MLTLPELLTDPRYKEFFLTVPKLEVRAGQKPWRLIIQREADGPWAKKEFEKYADAFRFLRPYLRGGKLHDGAIQSRGVAYAPPARIVKVTKGGKPVMAKSPGGQLVQKTALVVWKPRVPASEEAHIWCTYCRRPTVFRWFRTHHLLRGTDIADIIDPSDRRCTICGAREAFVRSTAGSARPVGYDPRTINKKLRRNTR
jgi:hypothetical protein